MLVSARGECSPQNLKGKDFLRFPVQGSTIFLCQCSYSKAEERKWEKKCLSRGGSGTWHNIHCLNMFQQAFSDLFASASPLTLLSSKERRETDSSECYPFCFLFLSFLSHCWDNCKRLYHWLAMGYHFVGELYTEVELQVELNNVFTFCSLSLEA